LLADCRLLTLAYLILENHLRSQSANLSVALMRTLTLVVACLVAGRQELKSNPGPLLERTGDLRHSFEDIMFDDYAVIFNTAEYFKYHQSRAPRAKLPRRVMMKIDQARKQFIQKSFQKYNDDLIKRSK
jgi:hypothetical protein